MMRRGKLVGDLVLLLFVYLIVPIKTSRGLSGNYICDVNLCDADFPPFQCKAGSVLLIQEVMCRRGSENCDEVAFREVTRVCSGRQYCQAADLWFIRGQFCPKGGLNDDDQVVSLVFVSYVCISGKAMESNCSRRGVAVSQDQRYVSSPGYPALVIGSSVCAWRIHPPTGYDVDIFVREYLHVDKSDKLFVRVREMLKNKVGLKLDRNSERGMKFTLKGDIEILMFTHGAVGGHRVWIEYRFVRSSTLAHLRPFLMPNRTDCGVADGNSTATTYLTTTRDNRIQRFHNTSPITSPVTSSVTSSSTVVISTDVKDLEENAGNSSLWRPSEEKPGTHFGQNETIVQEEYESDTDIPIIIASCVVGLVFTVTLICIVKKCRWRKKPGPRLGPDTMSVASDRALLACTPTQRRCHFVINSVTLNSADPSAGTGNNVMLSEDMDPKPESSSDKRGISVVGHHSYQQELDFNPIDFTKYIISNQPNAGDKQYSEHGV